MMIGGEYAVISIHALMKRATPKISFKFSASADFNPRPHEEGDTCVASAFALVGYFNPRPHEEGDYLSSVK